ncbi:MAG: cytochrome C oxidase Cbb3 [Proteobacteria bacterium]|nr:MAG: cytochrome C oxidase Cbb3 [Pseudomonadota bacterium]
MRPGEAPPPAADAPEPGAAAPADGAQVYAQRCQSCHQANGEGMPPSFPPLVGSRWVTGAPEIPVRVVLAGLQGPIEVRGTTYQGAMPAWGPLLSDAEIAAVVSHVRALPGNGAPPVDAALVARLRGEGRTAPWTAAELEAATAGAAP